MMAVTQPAVLILALGRAEHRLKPELRAPLGSSWQGSEFRL